MKNVSIENLIEKAKTWNCDIEYYVQPCKILRGYELSAYAKKFKDMHPLYVGTTKNFLQKNRIINKLKSLNIPFKELDHGNFVY